MKLITSLSKAATVAIIAMSANYTTDLHAEDRSQVDAYQAGSQHLAYPRPAYGMPELTATPAGYVPFHIEHYGRHGSRWLLKDDDYKKPVKYLQKAADHGKLTLRGLTLLSQLKQIKAAAKDRYGELTPLGHRQHRDIARRMTENFPEIFVPGTHIDAKSTVVIRCILSMANEVAEMQRLHPYLTATCDASRSTQKLLAFNSTDTVSKKLAKEKFHLSDSLESRIMDYSAFTAKVFNDPQWVADSLDIAKVFGRVFDIAVNTQSHDDQPNLYDLFTPDELHNQWMANNAWWYINSGNSQLTGNRQPYSQRHLLRNFIASADTAITSTRNSVNLRFGHESIVLPLTILMELNGMDYDTADLATLSDHWRNYDVFPMASNIQVIFYRPSRQATLSADEVLVKILLNEQEATLPLQAVDGPYYRWSDVRRLWDDKLRAFTDRFGEADTITFD